jgi:hypothetical protein
MLLHRKRQELSLGGSPEHPRHARIQKSDDSAKHPVWCGRIALMQPEHAIPSEAQHDRAIVVRHHCRHILKSEQPQTIAENEVQLLPGFPADPHTRLHHSP